MASYNELLALIDAYINQNGVQAITGQVLNGVLRAMVDQLGRGYSIMGAADPTTDPGTPDGPETWFASVPGTYTNFDGIQIVPGELALLSYVPSDGFSKNTIYEGFQTVQATADDNIGYPQVGVSYANGVLSFDFRNIKGEPGENGQDGDPAGFGTVNATVDDQVGTPSVSVSSSGPDTAKNFTFAFRNLKGETGVTSVLATVDNTSGNPQCAVSLQNGQLTLAFTGLKGAQGDTGSSVDYPFTIVNNLTTNDATQALSAAMGVQLESEVSQLEAKVGDLTTSSVGDNSDSIEIQDEEGNTVVKIEDEGVEVSSLKVGGVPVMTETDKEELEESISEKQPKINDVQTGNATEAEDNIEIQDEEGNTVVKITPTGIDAKGVKINGSPVAPGFPLSGKKVAIFGDSIMEFRDYAGKGVPEYFAEITGATVYRCAIGGLMLARRLSTLTPIESTTYVNQLINYLDFGHSFPKIATPLSSRNLDDVNAAWEKIKTDYDQMTRADVVTTMSNWNNLDFEDIDIVIMSAGTNDTRYIQLGDDDATSETTINGSVNNIVSTLLTNFPHISLYFFTPTVRYIEGVWSDDYISNEPGMNQLKPVQLYDGIAEAAKRNHIPVKDMYRGMGWTVYNFNHYCHPNDGTHPYEGFKNMAKAMSSFIMSNETYK